MHYTTTKNNAGVEIWKFFFDWNIESRLLLKNYDCSNVSPESTTPWKVIQI